MSKSSQPSNEGVVIESTDAVLHIRLDRPKRKNALPPPAVLTIVRALEDAATNESLRAIVIGSTGSDFCSGADWVSTNTPTKGSGDAPRIRHRSDLPPPVGEAG